MSSPRSIYSAQKNDPAEQVILTGLAEGGATAAPTAGDKGYQLQGADRLHVYAKMDVTVTALAVQLWYYSPIAAGWFTGPLLQLSAIGAKRLVLNCHGEHKVFPQVTATTGTGTYKLWGGYSFEGRN